MFSQVRYRCEHLLNYGIPVPYCTVRNLGPSPACTSTVRVLVRLYCSRTVLYFNHYYSSPCSYVYSTVAFRIRVFPQVRYCCAHLLNYYGTGTVPQCTVLRPLSCLYLYSYEYATVLYCTVRVPYCISNNIPRARTSTGAVSKSCKQCRYSTVRVVYSSRTVSYRSTVLE